MNGIMELPPLRSCIGIFIGFYHVATTDEKWISIAMEMKYNRTKQIEMYLNDESCQKFTYIGLSHDGVDGCTYRKQECTNEAPVCHYVVPNCMFKLHSLGMQGIENAILVPALLIHE